jgi:hypothetical protein
LRSSTKRARDSPPVELPSSPPPAVVSHDGVKSRPVTAEDDVLDNHRGPGPRIPAFLESSMQGIYPPKRDCGLGRISQALTLNRYRFQIPGVDVGRAKSSLGGHKE